MDNRMGWSKQKEMSFLINQLVLAGWNLINSRVDAYRILSNKSIAHGVNFSLYAIFVLVLAWLGQYDIKTVSLFCVSAFLNRQFSFDIPLNLRRGLKWYYQSIANPPKAILDKIERKLFGVDYDGKKIAAYYGAFYVFVIVIYLYDYYG